MESFPSIQFAFGSFSLQLLIKTCQSKWRRPSLGWKNLSENFRSGQINSLVHSMCWLALQHHHSRQLLDHCIILSLVKKNIFTTLAKSRKPSRRHQCQSLQSRNEINTEGLRQCTIRRLYSKAERPDLTFLTEPAKFREEQSIYLKNVKTIFGHMKSRLTCYKMTGKKSMENKEKQLIIWSISHYLSNMMQALLWHGHV